MSSLNANLVSLTSLQPEKITAEGFIIAHTHPTAPAKDAERYLNPKMEQELKAFKKKIALRFEQAEIPKDYAFP